uniref:Uncharacterized protein n=1 Tax=Tetraselmis sp. GSL018 TaxID=582737 RepID=A0A061S3J3_9CHLO
MAQSVTSVTYLSPLLGSCTPRGDNSVQFLLPILFLTILRHSVAALDATPVAPRVNTAPGVFASSSSLFGTPNYDPELELGYGESYRVNYEGGSWTPSSFSDVASFVATEETADLEGLFYTGQATASNKGSSRDPMPGGLETDAATSAACASNSMPETKSQGHDTEAARKTVFSQYVRWLQLADSVDVLFQLAEDHGDDFNSLETTTFVAELAKRRAELRTTAAVTAVNRVLLPLTLNPNSFPTAHLSKLLSSLAFLRYRHTEAFAKANAVLKARTDHATLHTQAISDLAWAFASMGFRAPELFEKLAAVALLRFNSFSPRALSDMLWAFASHLRILPSTQEKLFEMAEPRLATETGLLFPGTLAKLCWAYAVAREPAPKLFAAASDRLELNAAAFGISELGQMLWALTLGECDLGPGAVEAAARRIVDLPKPGMTITDISALAWSLGKHGVPEGLRGDLEGALSEGLLALLPNATGGDVAGGRLPRLCAGPEAHAGRRRRPHRRSGPARALPVAREPCHHRKLRREDALVRPSAAAGAGAARPQGGARPDGRAAHGHRVERRLPAQRRPRPGRRPAEPGGGPPGRVRERSPGAARVLPRDPLDPAGGGDLPAGERRCLARRQEPHRRRCPGGLPPRRLRRRLAQQARRLPETHGSDPA